MGFFFIWPTEGYFRDMIGFNTGMRCIAALYDYICTTVTTWVTLWSVNGETMKSLCNVGLKLLKPNNLLFCPVMNVVARIKVLVQYSIKWTYPAFFLFFLFDRHITELLIWEREFVSGKGTCCSWGTACVCWLSVGWRGLPWLPVFVWWESWRELPSSPPSHLWEGGLCLLRRPSLDKLFAFLYQQRKDIKVKGQIRSGERELE